MKCANMATENILANNCVSLIRPWNIKKNEHMKVAFGNSDSASVFAKHITRLVNVIMTRKRIIPPVENGIDMLINRRIIAIHNMRKLFKSIKSIRL